MCEWLVSEGLGGRGGRRRQLVYSFLCLYSRLMFWVDLIGVIPFGAIAVGIFGDSNDRRIRFLALFRFLRLVGVLRSLIVAILQELLISDPVQRFSHEDDLVLCGF